VLCCFAFIGCSSASTERTLWQAGQIKRTIFEKPQEASAGDYARARKLYEKVVQSSANDKEKAEATVSLAELAGHQGNVAEADRLYNETLNNYSSNVDVGARATYGRARLAETKGNWPEAQTHYQTLLERYPDSPLALTVPIQLARTARRQQGDEEGQRAYLQAESYYARIYTEKAGTRRALDALSNQFLVFAEQKKWPDALGVLERIQSEYPGTPEAKNAFVTRARMIQDIQSKTKKKNPEPNSD
jgi:tetratricopeptide (TPR) repeat protein